MLTDAVSILLILAAAVVGGWYPLVGRAVGGRHGSFPDGEAFTTGVFLALSLVIMLPAGDHLFRQLRPQADLPLAAVLTLAAFVGLSGAEHLAAHRRGAALHADPPLIPLVTTAMIAIPSFMLGTALGVSDGNTAVFILLAVLVHKSSAGFGLALAMTRSTLGRTQCVALYSLFALATPTGIVVGADLRDVLGGDTLMAVKASTLSLAAGVFLYMATIHGLHQAPLIRYCCRLSGFTLMVGGAALTVAVRFVLGLAHAG